MIDKQKKVIILNYLVASEQNIEITIGRILSDNEELNAAEVISDIEALEKCRKYFEEKSDIFRRKICVEWDFNNKIKNEEFIDNVILVATVADVIASCVGCIPPVMVAVLLVKKGLHNFCNNCGNKDVS